MPYWNINVLSAAVGKSCQIRAKVIWMIINGDKLHKVWIGLILTRLPLKIKSVINKLFGKQTLLLLKCKHCKLLNNFFFLRNSDNKLHSSQFIPVCPAIQAQENNK